ncbi:MAG: Na+/H+ antiporter subunit E [Clostridia bacterium]|nr:Na+/H+ antiporter subunit E [Clostridia bacterium]
MVFVFIGLFICFCGRFTAEAVLFSLLVSAALFAFCCRFLGYSFKRELRFLRTLPLAAAYFAFLLGEIVRANFRLLRFIYSQKYVPEPCIVTFTTGLRSPILRTILADSITLTPGTITLKAEGNVLKVHCLDKSMAEGLENSLFEKRLRRFEDPLPGPAGDPGP